ncbi:MAG: hypothetical protein COA47_08660 [Robiginitomaculum sp.]|nr:MAG: hypothetical protein COA47_08660 [Robiginitomaculum sp.]
MRIPLVDHDYTPSAGLDQGPCGQVADASRLLVQSHLSMRLLFETNRTSPQHHPPHAEVRPAGASKHQQVVSRSNAAPGLRAGAPRPLVVLRDLVNGKTRFSEFLDEPERITASVLSARLGQMAKNGLVTRAPYCRRPLRYAYQLTPKSLGLHPVLVAMCQWTNVQYPDT